MAGKRVFTLGGIAAVGGGAYYLYNAGGDPKLAQKQLERMYLTHWFIATSAPG